MSNGFIIVAFPIALTLLSVGQSYLTAHTTWYHAEIERLARPPHAWQRLLAHRADTSPAATRSRGGTGTSAAIEPQITVLEEASLQRKDAELRDAVGEAAWVLEREPRRYDLPRQRGARASMHTIGPCECFWATWLRHANRFPVWSPPTESNVSLR